MYMYVCNRCNLSKTLPSHLLLIFGMPNRPDEVVTAVTGTTIEVVHSDAEVPSTPLTLSPHPCLR